MGMNAVEALRTLRYNKQQLSMIRSQLDYLEQPKIKVSKFDDDVPGERVSLHDQYMKMMHKKNKLKLEELQLRLEISAVEMALNEMAVTMPYETNAIKLKYIENRQIAYIGIELGVSDRTVKRKIKEGIQELERLLNLIE